MNRERYPSDAKDRQSGLAETLLPPDKKGGRPRPGVRSSTPNPHLPRGGVSWRKLPHDFPPWRTVYSQARRWKLGGVWESLHDRLRDEVRLEDGRPTRPSAAALDGRSVETAGHPGIRGYDAGGKNQRAQGAHPGRCAGSAAGRGGDARGRARP